MKIMLRNLTEQFLANLNKLPVEVGKQKPATYLRKSQPANNQFFSWQRGQPKLFDTFAIDQENVAINLSLLEKFENFLGPQEISYQNVLASYLQHPSPDAHKAVAMKNARAVRKMVAIVRTTVQEMRMIELHYSSRHKG